MTAKERPILFSGPLVRALLEGRKSVTRRPVKPQPPDGTTHASWIATSTAPGETGKFAFHSGQFPNGPTLGCVRCPFGTYGDRLWVREACCIEHKVEGVEHDPPHDDGRPVQWLGDDHEGRWWQQAHYRATDPAPDLVIVKADGEETSGCRWRPSIHMPRWASRITLEVTAVACERVQDITEEQARAEGFTDIALGDYARDEFWQAWDAMYAKRPALQWAANPWVWAVSFNLKESSR